MAVNHAKVASGVVKAAGGASNINIAAYCAIRPRLVLADESRVDQVALDVVDDLKGTFAAGGIFQIIVGLGDVDVVYQCMVNDHGVREVPRDEVKEEAEQDGNLFSRLIKMIADILIPVLPVLITGGLMMVLNNVLQAGFFNGKLVTDIYLTVADYVSLINLVSAVVFAFLFILVGSSATKRFGGSVYLGAATGVAMVSGSLLPAYSMTDQDAADAFWAFTGANPIWHLFDLEVDKIGYQAMVISVLCAAWILFTIKKRLHKRLSGTADFLLTLLITILVTGFLTFVLVGPVTRQLSVLPANGLDWTYNTLGVLGGSIFNFSYSPIVVTGLHQSSPAVEIPLLPQNSGPGDFIFSIAPMTNVAQGVAALVVSAKTRDARFKGLAGAGGASAVSGIIEPAIFGVNLRLKWPFLAGAGATAISSAGVILLSVRGAALGAASFVGFVSIRTVDIPKYLFLEVIVFVFSLGATSAYGLTRGKVDMKVRPAAVRDAGAVPAQVSEPTAVPVIAGAVGGAAVLAPVAAPAPKPAIIGGATDYSITAPLGGQTVPLEQVKDESFAHRMLDPDIVIAPIGGQAVSPADGEVTVALAIGHAYGLKTASGVQIFIHIGVDTVGLEGKGFTPCVAKDDMVRRGDVLAEADWDVIREAGYDTITPIVVMNKKKFEAVTPATSGYVSFGDMIAEVAPKA